MAGRKLGDTDCLPIGGIVINVPPRHRLQPPQKRPVPEIRGPVPEIRESGVVSCDTGRHDRVLIELYRLQRPCGGMVHADRSTGQTPRESRGAFPVVVMDSHRIRRLPRAEGLGKGRRPLRRSFRMILQRLDPGAILRNVGKNFIHHHVPRFKLYCQDTTF